MHPLDDAALSLLEQLLDRGVDMSLLAELKYTVQLTYSVSINTVMMEHCSFPLSWHGLEDGCERGGGSIPMVGACGGSSTLFAGGGRIKRG